jgi:hypothetical protein
MTSTTAERKNAKSMSNPCPDPMKGVETAGKIIGTLMGGIGLFAAIKKGWNNYREKHPTFRSSVLKSLNEIKNGQNRFDDINAATLRESIGSKYNLYVLEMGWCPRAQKEKVALLYDIFLEYYASDSDMPLIERDKQMILDLPESKDQRLEFHQ